MAAAFKRFKELLVEFYDANPPVALEGVEDAFRELRRQGIKVALTTGFSATSPSPSWSGWDGASTTITCWTPSSAPTK